MTMVRLFLVLIMALAPLLSHADAEQERRLTISAKIFPKIVALDMDLANKSSAQGKIVLGVVYRDDENKAKEISNSIAKKVSNLAGLPVKTEKIALHDLLNVSEYRFAGLLLAQVLGKNDMDKLIAHTSKYNTLLFSPFDGDIERGVTASIFVGARIQPYFNLSALNRANINLKPAIMRMSKTYE